MVRGLTQGNAAAKIEAKVLQRVDDDDLTLPALPAVAARALALLNGADFSLADVGRLLESDPMLAARLVRLTNSAAFATRSRATSIVDCVTRLGASEVRVFLLETSARQLLDSPNRRINQICRGLWEHSLAVAILAKDILKEVYGELSNGAYLAGLLHDIGKPVVAAMLLEEEARLGASSGPSALPETWLALIARVHRSIGVALADRWELPETVTSSIRDCEEYDADRPRSIANAVRFANALAKANGIYESAFDRADVEVVLFRGRQIFSIGDRTIERCIGTLRTRIASRLG